MWAEKIRQAGGNAGGCGPAAACVHAQDRSNSCSPVPKSSSFQPLYPPLLLLLFNLAPKSQEVGVTHGIGEATEVQRGSMTRPRSHNQLSVHAHLWDSFHFTEGLPGEQLKP